MKNDLTIRPASSGDIPSLVKLLLDLFSIETDFRPDAKRQAQGLSLLLQRKHSARIFVAETRGRVIGMCSIQVLISTAEGSYVGLVEDMAVKNTYRGHGIGSRLLEKAERWSREQGLKRLQLLADHKNTSAVSFYHARNWSSTDLICLRRTLF